MHPKRYHALNKEGEPIHVDHTVNTSCSYSGLSALIKHLMPGDTTKDLLDSFEILPICLDDVRHLKKEGWYVGKTEFEDIGGKCDTDSHTLWMDSRLTGHERDIVLCHEVAHAIYHSQENTNDLVNEPLTEFIGRNTRANPILLAEIWKTFGIPPAIYDKASLEAFKQTSGQRLFGFVESYFTETIMDWDLSDSPERVNSPNDHIHRFEYSPYDSLWPDIESQEYLCFEKEDEEDDDVPF